MRLPNLEKARLLGPRLGFGSPDAGMDSDVDSDVDVRIDPLPIQIAAPVKLEETPASLVSLAGQLEMELAGDPAVAEPTLAAPAAEPTPQPEPARKRKSGPLEGSRVGAIGFGRQDIGGLAAAMIEARARVEFLPRGEVGVQGEFDLFLVNCASIVALKREVASFRSVLASGTPAIVIGSRAAISVLRGSGDHRTWDFAATPLHLDELIWRAANLLARREDAGILKKLPARVVVADHDPFTRTLIESALTREGFICELAEDGEAAWTAIGKSEPGAVILDLTLPNRDGFQLMADIRRADIRKPKVIVLSARQSEADILRAFALGADDYVTKPFSPLELNARLTRLLGGAPEDA